MATRKKYATEQEYFDEWRAHRKKHGPTIKRIKPHPDDIVRRAPERLGSAFDGSDWNYSGDGKGSRDGILPTSATWIEVAFYEAWIVRVRPHALDAQTWSDLTLSFQHRIGRYKVDFALPAYSLAIELDGRRDHTAREDVRRDRHRQRVIEAHGWSVIRFDGCVVNWSADACVQRTIQAARNIAIAKAGG